MGEDGVVLSGSFPAGHLVPHLEANLQKIICLLPNPAFKSVLFGKSRGQVKWRQSWDREAIASHFSSVFSRASIKERCKTMMILILLTFFLDLEVALRCMLLIGSETTRRLSMTIQEVVAQTGISAYTIRFYEKSGVLPPVQRTASGVRHFTEADVSFLRFLLQLKRTGMSLQEI